MEKIMNKVNGTPELTEIDKAMEQARQAQAEEQLHEQVRMERLHVASMAMQGILASGDGTSAKNVALVALNHADELLKRIMK